MSYYGLLIISSFVLHHGTKRFSFNLLFSVAIAVTSAALLLAGFVTAPLGTSAASFTLILLALPGIGFAATMIFPFAIVGIINAAKTEEEGNNNALQMAILNCFICLPQIVSTIVNALIIDVYDIRFIVILGGVYFALGVAVVWIIKVPKVQEAESRETVADYIGKGRKGSTAC